VPLWTDAVHRPAAAGSQSYTLTMHGVLNNVGGAVVADGGHLYALRFAPVASAPASARRRLHEMVHAPGLAANDAITANAGWKLVHSRQLALAAGDVLRLTSYLELAYPAGFSLGISCISKLELLDAGGKLVTTSALAMKYITALLEVLPLRNELVWTAAAAGAHAARIALSCAREAASPTLTLVGGRTQLFVEQFRAGP
jgi:hypothetical protein